MGINSLFASIKENYKKIDGITQDAAHHCIPGLFISYSSMPGRRSVPGLCTGRWPPPGPRSFCYDRRSMKDDLYREERYLSPDFFIHSRLGPVFHATYQNTKINPIATLFSPFSLSHLGTPQCDVSQRVGPVRLDSDST